MIVKGINLEMVKFFNTSYREYVGIWKFDHRGIWVIFVYPFAIKLVISDEIRPPDEISNLSLHDKLGVKNIFNYHHTQREEIGVDPCDIYEWVSGIKIHRGESDKHMMGLSFEPQKRSLIGYMTRLKNLKTLEI